MLRRVTVVKTDFSGERHFLQVPHGETFQKTALFLFYSPLVLSA
jgi:hypothetical protein